MIKKIFLLLLLALLAFPVFGETAKDYLDRASFQYLVGNYDASLKNLREALKIDPQNRAALELKQNLLREKVWLSQRINDYMARGKEALERGDFLTASESFREVLYFNPGNEEVDRLLNFTLSKLHQEPHYDFYYLLGSVLCFILGAAALLRFLYVFVLHVLRAQKTWFTPLPRSPDLCFNCHAHISRSIDLCPNCGAWIGTKMRVSISREQKTWYDNLGWRKNPFTLDIHPELFTGYRNEVRQIVEKITARSGHILITGPLGVGKTTLLRWLASYLHFECSAVYLPRPPQQFYQVIEMISRRLGFPANVPAEYDVYHLDQMRRKLGKPLVLLLDEAHEFTLEFERPLRTLGDLDEVKLVMAGLPETSLKFMAEIQPLFERLVLEISLKQLDFEDLRELIRARIENAGGQGIQPFVPMVINKLFSVSKGNPRSAVKICDKLVSRAISQNEYRITPELFESVFLPPLPPSPQK